MPDTDNVTTLPSRFKDFDQAAPQKEPIRFKVRGKEYELPADIPAGPVWKMIRKGVDTTDSKAATEFLEAIIGVENVDQMLADGITLKQLTDVTSWVAEQYGLRDDKATGNPT